MAGAYAALVSLRHIIDQIEHHPRPLISLHKSQVQSLLDNITFLQEFLEGYDGSQEADHHHVLESRIADAAYAAEDIIESHIVDQIQAASTTNDSTELFQDVQQVIDKMGFIKNEVIEIKENVVIQRNSISASLLRSPLTRHNNTMVGFDDVLIEIMDKLTRQQSSRQTITIVGMGGIGKTTLARNIYVNQLIVQNFDILAWATISQVYNVKEFLLEVLDGLKRHRGSLSRKSEDELGEIIYKTLWGRRYLIVLDDIWSIEAWDKVKLFFPNNDNGSRIMITTRLSHVAFQLSSSCCIEMNFLDEGSSWNLLCKNVFGEEACCPLELEEIGKKIAKNCKGLPLSIMVIGGFLKKSQWSREYWQYIAENLISTVSLVDDERCSKILHMSYNKLPIHLKPCFLYMGVFPEDAKIRVSLLIKLWVVEGFLKPVYGKSLEMVAEENLNDLISRNLVLVDKLGSNGKIKICKIHDLLRDICLREAHKEKFLHVASPHNISQNISTQRRISIHQSAGPHVHALQSAPVARSLIGAVDGGLPLFDFRLLRVWNIVETNYKLYLYGDPRDTFSREAIFGLVNLRHLYIELIWNKVALFPSSVHLFWNLQTVIVKTIRVPSWHRKKSKKHVPENYTFVVNAPFKIWKMSQLRHVELDKLDILDPPMDCPDVFVLANLQTLTKIRNFKCGEEMVKRVPNIKKLGVHYVGKEECSSYCLNNLGRLNKLESLNLTWFGFMARIDLIQHLNFPSSLKKLTLEDSQLNWEDMTTKIGSLPNLQVLKLKTGSFIGPKWETVEGQFQSLKFFLIEECDDLEYWTTDSTHFPCLEHLVLRDLGQLKEILFEIGEMSTLKLIELEGCIESVVISTNEMLKEQEEYGNVDLQVRVRLWRKNVEIQSLASRNFSVEVL